MANKKAKKDNPNQLSLFDILTTRTEEEKDKIDLQPGRLNVQRCLRMAISEAIKRCPLSRWEIAAKMSELMDIEVSKYMIDAWTSEAKDGHRFPAEYLPSFCVVTGSMNPLKVLSEAAGVFTLPGPEALRAEIQRLDEEAKRVSTEKKKRMLLLKELDTQK